MNQVTTIKLSPPYLIFLGDVADLMSAKTGAGLVQWCPDMVVGQYRTSDTGVDLGVPDLNIEQAVEAGAKSLVIGVALVGGAMSQQWAPLLNKAALAGLDIVSGLHTDLADIPGLADSAKQAGVKLINVRRAPATLPIGNGRKRSGKRVLMVGTDCAVGKKYSALALSKAMNERGMAATFRATGQTGLMIAGSGIPVDSVIADFISGAAEVISPDNRDDHWDIIEGQGSLFNPSYSGVSLGLLHGSQPDAIVVCHDASREFVSSCADYRLPSVKQCIQLNLDCARITNPDVVCIGVCVNTSKLTVEARQAYLQQLSEELELPCIDPILDGCNALVDKILTLN
ncbi:DUF1611 domain-containing protein [Neptunicella sp. SCSIO 80796]|uniref:DUF1611 domain-containing protein n=1 Tax=Neptunicella plasticusilytica TaxID=3117012 RepID=UPI003A4DDDF3